MKEIKLINKVAIAICISLVASSCHVDEAGVSSSGFGANTEVLYSFLPCDFPLFIFTILYRLFVFTIISLFFCYIPYIPCIFLSSINIAKTNN